MHNFALNEIKEISGKIKFFKLFINSVCQFEEFLEQCNKDGNLKSEIIQLQSRMQQVSDLKQLPINKHRDITPKNESVKEYEFKSKHLRIYTIHDKKNGRIIVLAGKKTTQKLDIKKFRAIKKIIINQ